MILGLGGHVGPWAAQALPLEQPFLHFNHAGKQASWPCLQMMLEEWIFMYNLLILMLATTFFFFPRENSGNEISTTMCWNQPSVSAIFVFGLELGVQ